MTLISMATLGGAWGESYVVFALFSSPSASFRETKTDKRRNSLKPYLELMKNPWYSSAMLFTTNFVSLRPLFLPDFS